MAMQQAVHTKHHQHPPLDYEFPCPRCVAGTSYPHRVTTKGPETIVVGLVCDHCRFEWGIIRTVKDGRPRFQSDTASVTLPQEVPEG